MKASTALTARDNRAAGHQRRWFDPKISRVNLGGAPAECFAQGLPAAEGRQLPGNPENIAPMAVGQEEIAQSVGVAGRQREIERADPLIGEFLVDFLGLLGRGRQSFQHPNILPIDRSGSCWRI